jgi:hypothetical protein
LFKMLLMCKGLRCCPTGQKQAAGW